MLNARDVVLLHHENDDGLIDDVSIFRAHDDDLCQTAGSWAADVRPQLLRAGRPATPLVSFSARQGGRPGAGYPRLTRLSCASSAVE